METDQKIKALGTITEVHGPVVVIACDRLPPIKQALTASSDGDSYLFEVHQHLDKQHIRAVTLHRASGLYRGMPVFDTGEPLKIPVSPECLGRVLNMFGEPLDGGPALKTQTFRTIHSAASMISEATVSSEILVTGIKVIAILCPFIKGGKTGLFGGAGVGKTVLIM